MIAGLPECSVIKEKRHGLIFGERKGATVTVAMEWQERKVDSNHYHILPVQSQQKIHAIVQCLWKI